MFLALIIGKLGRKTRTVILRLALACWFRMLRGWTILKMVVIKSEWVRIMTTSFSNAQYVSGEHEDCPESLLQIIMENWMKSFM